MVSTPTMTCYKNANKIIHNPVKICKLRNVKQNLRIMIRTKGFENKMKDEKDN